MRNLNQNVVQASNGGGANVLGSLLNVWQRKKNMDYRYSRENELLTRQHELGTERDRTRMMNNIMAEGTGAAINSHFNNILETNKNANKMGQIEATGGQDRLTLKEGGFQDRRTVTHKAKKESAIKAQVHTQDTEMERLKAGNEIGRMSDEALYKGQNEEQVSGNRVKLEREKGRQARATQKNLVQTGVQGMRDISKDLYDNYNDPSVGTSPLVSGPDRIQNIGNNLGDHPFLNPNPNLKVAPIASNIGDNTGADDAGDAGVTPPKIVEPKVKRKRA